MNPECGLEYIPQSWVQKYCHGCRKYRDRLHLRNFMNKTVGRVCRSCGRTDADTGFRTKSECNGCYSRAAINGRCPKMKCPQPLRKLDGQLFCSIHTPITDPEKVTVVTLVHHGRRRRTYRTLTGEVRFGNKKIPYSSILEQAGEVTLLVNKRDFQLKQTGSPIAIKDVVQAPWPYSLGWLKDKPLDLLYDLAHFIRLGEARPRMTFEWWASKFQKHTTHASAQKGWERLKKRLLFLEAPFVLKVNYESALGMDVVFDCDAFVAGVTLEISRRES